MTCDCNRIQSGRTSCATGHGFTLVELLLTLALILLLAAAAAFNFTSLQRGSHLDEGMLQFEALLRYARAHAQNSGRPVQLVFEEPAAGTNGATAGTNRVLRLRWEPDPIGAPGVYQDLAETPIYVESIQEHLNLEEIRILDGTASLAGGTNDPSTSAALDSFTGSSTNSVAGSETSTGAGEGFHETPVIHFFPDGSSDSARFVLSSQDPEDTRRIAIELGGITGTIERKRAPRDGEMPDPEEELKEEDLDSSPSNPSRQTTAARGGQEP